MGHRPPRGGIDLQALLGKLGLMGDSLWCLWATGLSHRHPITGGASRYFECGADSRPRIRSRGHMHFYVSLHGHIAHSAFRASSSAVDSSA